MTARLPTSIVMALSCTLVTGCAYVNPYVFPQAAPYCGVPVPADDVAAKAAAAAAERPVACRALPAITGTVDSITGSTSAVQKKLNGLGGVTTVNRTLNLATFAGATALVAKATLGGTEHAKRSLGLGTAAAYTGGTLFTPASAESLYLASHASLVCIAGKGDALLATYGAANAGYKAVEDWKYDGGKPLVAYLENNSCPKAQDAPEYHLAVAEARRARQDAWTTLKQVEAMDGLIASKLGQAANNVLVEMNRQLLLSNPSPEAILQAARSQAALSAGLLEGAGGSPDKAGPRPTCPSQPPLQRLVAATSSYDAVRAQLAQQLNAVGDLGAACTAVNALPSKPLALSQTEVDAISGRMVAVAISGGRAPYRVNWVEVVPPSAKLTSQLFAESGLLHISAGTDAADDESFSLQVSDASVVPATLAVTVRTHAAPEPAPAAASAAAAAKARKRAAARAAKKAGRQ